MMESLRIVGMQRTLPEYFKSATQDGTTSARAVDRIFRGHRELLAVSEGTRDP